MEPVKIEYAIAKIQLDIQAPKYEELGMPASAVATGLMFTLGQLQTEFGAVISPQVAHPEVIQHISQGQIPANVARIIEIAGGGQLVSFTFEIGIPKHNIAVVEDYLGTKLEIKSVLTL